MADQPLIVQLEVGGALIDVRTLRGREALSEPYRLVAEATLFDGVSIDPAAIIKSAASITLVRDGVRRRIDGLVSEAVVMQSVSGRPELSLVLEPRWALSRFRTNIKIYRDKAAPDIVSEVLGELGVTFELRLSDSYPVRPYTVQHRETDFHFVSRMLEEEGMFYFIADGDKMVIGDNPSAYDSAGSFPFLQPDGMDRNDESVWALGELAEAGVSKVSLRDWNIDKPSLPQDVAATGPTRAGPEWYDFPGEYTEPTAGQRIADRMAEAYACAADAISGTASVAAFAPGRTFSVEGSPAGAIDGSFVLTQVEHDFERTRDGFSVGFEGLDAETTFRPERRHEEPILAGPVTGFVTGPPGEDIHCDELGRIKVQFHWDRLLPKDDTCSHWIPVVQDNTGHSVQIPRIGWEVLVHFLEGDPDRPVVLGRVYNAFDPFPIELPARKMWTSLRSMSSPTRDGSNEIQFIDQAGQQRVSFFAEKDQNVVIANDKREHVMSNETRNIERDEAIAVGADQTIDVGGDVLVAVLNDQTVSIGGNNEQTVAKGSGISVGADHSLTIGGNHQRRIGTNDVAAAKNITEVVGAAILEASISGNALSASKGMAVVVGGAMLELAQVLKNESASVARAETIGGVVFSKAKGEHKVTARESRVTTVGGMLKIAAKKQMAINGADKLTMQSATQKHEAQTSITFEVGSTTLTMKDELIHIVTPKISLTVSGANELGAGESYQN